MKAEQAKALLPIITAFAEGKTIEFNFPEDNLGWVKGTDFNFEYNPEFYRVQPAKVIYQYKRYLYTSGTTKTLYICTNDLSVDLSVESINRIYGNQILWIDTEWQIVEL